MIEFPGKDAKQQLTSGTKGTTIIKFEDHEQSTEKTRKNESNKSIKEKSEELMAIETERVVTTIKSTDNLAKNNNKVDFDKR